MKKALLSAILVLTATAAQATPITYTAALSGANENPAVVTDGTGFATVTYDGFQETSLMQRVDTAAQTSHAMAYSL